MSDFSKALIQSEHVRLSQHYQWGRLSDKEYAWRLRRLDQLKKYLTAIERLIAYRLKLVGGVVTR